MYREEFATRYILYSRAANVPGIKDSTRNHLLDLAYFWFIAYCYGKKVAQAESLIPYSAVKPYE